MENLTIETLINNVEKYNKNAKKSLVKAYELAEYLHRNQLRQSGEPYIIHPLNVAYMLSKIQADCDTLCAALLHDTLEDTDITYKEIKNNFNKDVAKLVDGVTKISRMNFSTKQEQNNANARKIIMSLGKDVRIIFIKLIDRLHNMRTIQYKSEFKQKENSLETLKQYVPVANYVGIYRVKTELEDISFRCLDPYNYQKIEEQLQRIKEEANPCIMDMVGTINEILSKRNLSNEIRIETKNIYGIYKKLQSGHTLDSIHNLITFKIMIDNIDDCYLLLRPIHENYKSANIIKDYICNPKTNFYQSLHTTVFSKEGRLIQIQIKTKEMDKVGSFGLTRYWATEGENAKNIMQSDLKNKYQFYSSLKEIDKVFSNDEEFIKHVEKELFSDQVYVFTSTGQIIELPLGSTLIDFAYKATPELTNNMIGAMVNEEIVPLDYKLKSGDRVKILTKTKVIGPKTGWEEKAMTTLAKRKIREQIYSQNTKTPTL